LPLPGTAARGQVRSGFPAISARSDVNLYGLSGALHAKRQTEADTGLLNMPDRRIFIFML